MKQLMCVWMLLGSLSFAYSQTVTITDELTEEPVEMVILMSDAPKAYASTNTKGQANIDGFKNSKSING